MSPKIINQHAFADVLSQTGWADIDTLYDACVEAEVFDAAFLSHAAEIAGKAEIRRQLRSGKVEDSDGKIIKVANIIMEDDDGKKQRVYKQEMLFDVGDFIQVCRYWKGKVDSDKEKLRYYVDLAVEMHGRQIQGLLNFDD